MKSPDLGGYGFPNVNTSSMHFWLTHYKSVCEWWYEGAYLMIPCRMVADKVGWCGRDILRFLLLIGTIL